MPTNKKAESEGLKSPNNLDKVKLASKKGVETISKEAPKIASTVAQKIKEVVTVVVEKTKKGAIITKTKLQIANLKRQTDKIVRDLGRKVYAMSKAKQTNILDNDEVKQFINKVEDLEAQIEGLQKRLIGSRNKK